MKKAYDLIVLGTGTAGGRIAHGCRKRGWSVAQVEAWQPGGTCARRGCDAKKPLVNAAAAVDSLGRLNGCGLVGQVQIDWPELIEFERSFTEPVGDPSRLLNRKPLQSFSAVFAGDIFRTNKPVEPARPRVPEPVLQETRLNLRLKGTVVGEDTPSYAMIYDSRTRKEEMYRVDEYVQGVRIERIRPDGVILQGEEGRELLRLAEPDPKGRPPRQGPKQPSRKRRPGPEQHD
jgi:glutathione reductase (NADPH)